MLVLFVELVELLVLDLHPIGKGMEQGEALLGTGLAGLGVGRRRGGVVVLKPVAVLAPGRGVGIIPIGSTSG
ncbi:MAG: hypothetical protein ACIAXF_02590 [Phycisphaerales bacterium JB063]